MATTAAMRRSAAPMAAALALAVVFASAASAQYAAGDRIAGRVVSIQDGDTLTVLTAENRQVRIRIANIDAPEDDQPFGERSKQMLAALAFGRGADIAVDDVDSYRRPIGRVRVGRDDVNATMVRQGGAWVFALQPRPFAGGGRGRSPRGAPGAVEFAGRRAPAALGVAGGEAGGARAQAGRGGRTVSPRARASARATAVRNRGHLGPRAPSDAPTAAAPGFLAHASAEWDRVPDQPSPPPRVPQPVCCGRTTCAGSCGLGCRSPLRSH